MLTILQTSCGVVWPCAFPLGWLYFQIGYMISLIALFTNFYIQVNLTLLWRLRFGVLAAKALICSLWGAPALVGLGWGSLPMEEEVLKSVQASGVPGLR